MTKKTTNFYDTSSLLLLDELDDYFAISSITIEELERIKTSVNKENEIKQKAQQLAKKLNDRIGTYKIVMYNNNFEKYLPNGFTNNDAKIIACARAYQEHEEGITFITNDLNLKLLAGFYFDKVESVEPKEDVYCGFTEITLDESQMEDFYSTGLNNFDILENEYMIIKNPKGEVVDLRVWRNGKWDYLDAAPIKSRQLGTFAPYDIYQKMAIDCMRNNELAVLRGKPGSGKSLAATTYLFSLLEQNKIDKIIIFCNTVATAGAAKLGLTNG